MSDLYVIGGQQNYLLPLFANESQLYEYHKAVILRLDTDLHHSERVLDYVSPESAKASIGSMLFKAGSVADGVLYVCTTTEVIMYAVPEFTQVGYISLPMFNDVHHVSATPWNTLAVANTGLDMVVEMTREGEVLREWDALGREPWSHFSRDVDYRPLNTKPHKAHPNFLFFLDEEPWATRFYQKDAINLNDPNKRIDIAVGSPHDGLVHGDFVYFTTTNGHIVIANKQTLAVDEIINMNEIHRHGGPLGWSRGIFVGDDKIWVGYSRLRPTKLRENVEWVKHTMKWRFRRLLPNALTNRSKWMKEGPKNQLPTRLACYDLSKKICLQEINLEEHGLSAVFSIFSGAQLSSAAVPSVLSTVNVEAQDFPQSDVV